MARTRSSIGSNGASQDSAAAAALDSSSAHPGRITRSGSSRSLANSVGTNAPFPAVNEAESTHDPRGRPRKSAQFGDSPVAPSTRASSSGGPAGLRRSIKSTFPPNGSVSGSSMPTTVDATSESEYSTPATSKFPTPSAADLPPSSKPTRKGHAVEVQIQSRGLNRERALRKSKYSMKASKSRDFEVGDTEDEIEAFSDNSPDAQVARRLQHEENMKAGPSLPLPSAARRATRAPASNQTTALPPNNHSTKRGRASEGSSVPPAKKSKNSTATDDDANMDEALARQMQDEEYQLDSANQDASAYSEPEDSDGTFEDTSGDTTRKTTRQKRRVVDEDSDDDVPLARRPRTAPSFQTAANIHLNQSGEAPSRSLEALDDADLATEESFSTELDLPTASDSDSSIGVDELRRVAASRRAFRRNRRPNAASNGRNRLEAHHPEIKTMWKTLTDMPVLKAGKAEQPQTISRRLKPFQLEGLAWMRAMEKMEWKGGLLGDEMGLGKTIQAVSLIMSDYPAKQPSLVLVPPVALMQWQSEIKDYTDGTLKTFVFHGTNQKTKGMTVKDLKKYDVIMMSYNSLESMYRKQEKGFKRKDGIYKEQSVIHSIHFHRIILDEAHSIKTRSTMTAKACFGLKTDYRWCLTGTPLQNRIGELFSLIRFLNIRPFSSYLCKQCPCSSLEWAMDEDKRCTHCNHAAMQHVSVFNQELLNPIQKYGNMGPGRRAFSNLRLMTDRIMLRRLKKDHTNSMELPVKEVYVDRQFFGEEENDFANSIMTNGQRKFDTYVAQGVLLNNYANIFGLIMQMRQVADHPDLILRKNAEGGQNVLVCCICDEPAEDTIKSRCKHDFCRACVASYVRSTDEPDCPRCHIPLSIDLEQPEIEQDESLVKKTSIINRIKMDNWTSSSKIELLVHELHKLRSDNATHKSIIFSQFTTMLQLIEWRLRRAGITTVMLDGSMTPAQRQASIEHFMNNVDVECFLVSLKAGGVALNLTEASRVFIVDPWWNPAAEWQSADRCHRIGQTRPCTITRLCIEDSVESRMVLIQEKKTNMIHSTVNADDKAMESLTPQDMQFLFRGT